MFALIDDVNKVVVIPVSYNLFLRKFEEYSHDTTISMTNNLEQSDITNLPFLYRKQRSSWVSCSN